MKALPRRRRAWVSPVLLLSAAGVGCVLAVFWGPWGNLPAVGLADLLAPSSRVLVPWMFALGVGGALIWSVMAAVLRLEW
jgi:hypothetical protein